MDTIPKPKTLSRAYFQRCGRKGGQQVTPAKIEANRQRALAYWAKRRAEKEA